MYEVTISVDNDNSYLLDYAGKTLVPVVNGVGGIATTDESKFRKYLCLACKDNFADSVKKTVTDVSADVLSIGFKNIFLRSKLNAYDNNFLVNTVINTMCVFDNTYDKQYVTRMLDVDNPIYYEGYYNFRMNPLKQKWREITDITNCNSVILSDDALMKEFLCYLADAIPIGAERITLTVDNNGYSLFDDNGRLVETCNSLSNKSTYEEEAMLNVICMHPRSVVLYSDNKRSNEFVDLLACMFNLKITNAN